MTDWETVTYDWADEGIFKIKTQIDVGEYYLRASAFTITNGVIIELVNKETPNVINEKHPIVLASYNIPKLLPLKDIKKYVEKDLAFWYTRVTSKIGRLTLK